MLYFYNPVIFYLLNLDYKSFLVNVDNHSKPFITKCKRPSNFSAAVKMTNHIEIADESRRVNERKSLNLSSPVVFMLFWN